jgi:hypothetical protein
MLLTPTVLGALTRPLTGTFLNVTRDRETEIDKPEHRKDALEHHRMIARVRPRKDSDRRLHHAAHATHPAHTTHSVVVGGGIRRLLFLGLVHDGRLRSEEEAGDHPAFSSAERVTLAGSIIPAPTRSTYSPVAAFRP